MTMFLLLEKFTCPVHKTEATLEESREFGANFYFVKASCGCSFKLTVKLILEEAK